MPPISQHNKQSILTGAMEFTREKGLSHLTARGLAAFLGISTFPIIQNFPTMETLINAVKDGFMKEIACEQEKVKAPELYQRLLIGFVIYTWKNPKSYEAIRDSFGPGAWKEMEKAMKEFPPFQNLPEERFYTLLIRFVHFNQGAADFAYRGMLYKPTEPGITDYLLRAFDALSKGD